MVFGTKITLENTTFLVDGFSSKSDTIKHYVLSHFHTDHTAGLGKTFSHGKIYCTECTRDLIVNVTGVKSEFVVGVKLGEAHYVKLNSF